MSRQYEKKIEIAASPEKVWEALSTADGVASWFAPIVKVEPGVGGTISGTWVEGMEGGGQNIAIWEPGKHLQLTADRAPGKPPSVIDYFIESQGGGTTMLRLVHSGFEDGADFDNEFNSYTGAWPVFMLMLKASAEQGIAAVRNIAVFRMLNEPRPESWKKLTGPDGLCAEGSLENLQPGAAFRIRTSDGELLEGKVRHLDNVGCCMLELANSTFCIFCERCGGKSMLTLHLQLFGASAEKANEVRDRWGSRVDRWFGLSKQAEA
ncbi:MAG TPA: SRPBCC domain-containing protein [Bryobacteraceae bacterium]|jgi:uncharacterized protein YndB with AHSA1/START domain|nr:SRPBCC domain-containing protein [Bryobacteraceae bacterium]